jgi:hypothetical protein
MALTSLRRRLWFGLKSNKEPGSVIARGLVGVTIRYGVAWWRPRPGHRPGGFEIDARRAASTHRRSRQFACLSSERCGDKRHHDVLHQRARKPRKPSSPKTSTRSKRARKPKSPRTSLRSKKHPETRSPKNQKPDPRGVDGAPRQRVEGEVDMASTTRDSSAGPGTRDRGGAESIASQLD